MDIFTVRDNLINTIKGKKAMLASLDNNGKEGYYVLSHMLSMNIDELEKILADVEVCCAAGLPCSAV